MITCPPSEFVGKRSDAPASGRLVTRTAMCLTKDTPACAEHLATRRSGRVHADEMIALAGTVVVVRAGLT